MSAAPFSCSIVQYKADGVTLQNSIFTFGSQQGALALSSAGAAQVLPMGSVAAKDTGNSAGQVPVVPIPLGCMDLTMTLPMRATGNVVSVDLATPSAAGVISAADLILARSALQPGASIPYSTITGAPSIPAAQVNSDWNASSGLAQILNKPTLGTAASMNSSSFATAAQGFLAASALQPGASIPWATVSGPPTTLAGYGITDAVPSTRTVNGHALSSNVTVTQGDVGLGLVENTALSTWSGSANIATVGTIVSGTWSGTAIADGKIASAATWNAKQNAITTGTTAQYLRGDLSLATFPTALSSFTNDSAFVNATGARSAISLTTTGTSGNATYNSSTGVFNVPNYAVAASRTFSTPTFSGITTAAQLSTTRDAEVFYDIDATVVISLLAGQSVTATLTYADNSGMSTNPVVVSSQGIANSGVLGLTQINTLKLAGLIPANKFRKVTFATTNSAATPAALKAGQEVLV